MRTNEANAMEDERMNAVWDEKTQAKLRTNTNEFLQFVEEEYINHLGLCLGGRNTRDKKMYIFRVFVFAGRRIV